MFDAGAQPKTWWIIHPGSSCTCPVTPRSTLLTSSSDIYLIYPISPISYSPIQSHLPSIAHRATHQQTPFQFEQFCTEFANVTSFPVRSPQMVNVPVHFVLHREQVADQNLLADKIQCNQKALHSSIFTRLLPPPKLDQVCIALHSLLNLGCFAFAQVL